MGTGRGYLSQVRAWRRFGFGAVGNLIVYDDRFVLAASPEWDRLNPLAGRSRYERLAQEQVALPPEVLMGCNSRNWAVRFEDVSSARCRATAGSSAQSSGDSVLDVVLDVAAAASDALDRDCVLTLVLAGTKTRYPRIRGTWGEPELELLKSVLGSKLAA